MDAPPRLLGVLVTYRRPAALPIALARLAAQSRLLDELVVVDNAASDETREIVGAGTNAARRVEYLASPENLGFTGGLAIGMDRLLERARDDDWIVVLDDDNPPFSDALFGELERFAHETAAADPRTAAVGMRGARFDWRRGRVSRVPTSELHGAVAVDHVAGNGFGLYRVGVVRTTGTFAREIFFGFSECEYGLRLTRAGHTLYGHGELWRGRRAANTQSPPAKPSMAINETPDWRSYYSLRNLIYILLQGRRRATALRVTVGRGLLKPLLNLVVTPRRAAAMLRLNVKACRDAWTGQMGRRVEPEPWGTRPRKLAAASNAGVS